jgi:hypothetical protein
MMEGEGEKKIMEADDAGGRRGRCKLGIADEKRIQAGGDKR